MINAETLKKVRAANLERQKLWHPEGWPRFKWLNALGGEVGEVMNVLKKLDRDDTGIAGIQAKKESLIDQLGAELADVFIYLDLAMAQDGKEIVALEVDIVERDIISAGLDLFHATHSYVVGNGEDAQIECQTIIACLSNIAALYDIDLDQAIIDKFNAVSKRSNFPIFIT